MKYNHNYIRLFITLLLVTGLITACQKQFSKEQYIQQALNTATGAISERTISGMKISVTYLPSKAVACMETRDEETDYNQLEERVNELNAYHHIRIRFTPENSSTEFIRFNANHQDIIHQRLQHLNSFFNHDVILINGNDTLPCVLHHFERTYKLTSHGDISLLFEKEEQELKELKLIYYDQLFQLGELHFPIDKEKIEHLSKLTIN